MIEKTIRYEEVKPSKPKNIKPVKQGGRLNYLGKQKTITAPVRWKSGPTHPETHLAYITKQEQDILVELDLYKSMNGKPNKGPFGLPSLNDGDGSGGGGSGSDGAGAGDSGGSGGGASASGGGGDDGAGASSAGDAGASTGDSGGVGGSGDSTSGEGVGSGPGGEAGTGGVSAANAANTESGITTAVNAVQNAVKNSIQNAINNPVATAIGITMGPVAGLAARGIAAAVDAANRGVTGPSDDTQETSSVQSGPSQSPSDGGGITTLVPTYAPLVNQMTGDPLLDSLIARYRINPSAFGII